MLASSIRSVVLSAAIAALAPFGAGCYATAQFDDPGAVDPSYQPSYYDDGSIVYYDTGGRPYYYNNNRTYYIPASHPRYSYYSNHYTTYGPRYHRWNNRYGTRYRSYRNVRYRR